MTQLDNELQQLAINRWQEFVELIGDDPIQYAKICLLKQRGKSFGEIQNQLGITKDAVRWGVGKCCPNAEIKSVVQNTTLNGTPTH